MKEQEANVKVYVKGNELVQGAGAASFEEVERIVVKVGRAEFDMRPAANDSLVVYGSLRDDKDNDLGGQLCVLVGISPAYLTFV